MDMMMPIMGNRRRESRRANPKTRSTCVTAAYAP
jgi:hypothetical protein